MKCPKVYQMTETLGPAECPQYNMETVYPVTN